MATCILKMDIPATQGYFNLGDSMIYVVALLFGPIVGGIAGGVGSALADVALAAIPYSPGTLIIKGVEGIIVGYLGHKITLKVKSITTLKISTGVLGIFLGTLTYYLGSNYYILGSYVLVQLFWATIAVLFGAFLIYVGLRHEPMVSWQVMAVICGGVEMILGYYMYETYILPLIMPGWQIIAAVEIPFNVGQMVIGLIIALPIVRTVRHAAPFLKDH